MGLTYSKDKNLRVHLIKIRQITLWQSKINSDYGIKPKKGRFACYNMWRYTWTVLWFTGTI